MPARIGRKKARAHGLTRYFTGEPCKHGHRSDRYALGGHCVACHRVDQMRYYYEGPQTQQTELQAINQCRAMIRGVSRLCRNPMLLAKVRSRLRSIDDPLEFHRAFAKLSMQDAIVAGVPGRKRQRSTR
jgi:hypothetical protein